MVVEIVEYQDIEKPISCPKCDKLIIYPHKHCSRCKLYIERIVTFKKSYEEGKQNYAFKP